MERERALSGGAAERERSAERSVRPAHCPLHSAEAVYGSGWRQLLMLINTSFTVSVSHRARVHLAESCINFIRFVNIRMKRGDCTAVLCQVIRSCMPMAQRGDWARMVGGSGHA